MITEKHLDDTYGHPQPDWELAKKQARSTIVKCGAEERFITYQDLTHEISAIKFQPDDDIFHHLLGQISWEEDSCGRGMLTALVVHKEGDKMPGSGFWKLAKLLKRNISDKVFFWQAEAKRIFADCKSGKIPS